MISNLNGSSELYLASLERIQRSITTASQQLSSGKRITTASDAADLIEPLLQLRAERLHNSQIRTNLALASTEANAADEALASAIKLMDRARTLAAQGANTTLDATSREAIATEVQSLQEQMVAYTRAAVLGRYIFSGDQDGVPAYELDLTAANGVSQLTSATSTRRIEDPAGGSFASAETAQEIFDSRETDGSAAADNVFAALNSLRLALLSNNVDAVADAAASVALASDHLNSAEAFYGNVQRRIADADAYAGSYDIQLQTELSQKEDADTVAAALQLTQSSTQLKAALQMRANLPTKSLFDYLG
jgi:flagellar hook-associated protein 3 FlgL